MLLTEINIIEHCVANPSTLSEELKELNLDSIQLAQDLSYTDEQEIAKKRASRMFYKTWSAMTKYIRASLFQQRRPLEVPDFAIFVPPHHEQSPSSAQNDTSHIGTKSSSENTKVKLIINEGFFKQCGEGLTIFSQFSQIISTYNPKNKALIAGVKGLAQLNTQSMAKACSTDAQTVELILKELLTTIPLIAAKGENLRLNLRVGTLILRNGLISFTQPLDTSFLNKSIFVNRSQSLVQDENRQVIYKPNKSVCSSSDYPMDNQSRIDSVHRKQLSVVTPSLGQCSISRSTVPKTSSRKSYHISNPNPQQGKSRYQGVKESGYQSLQNTPNGKADLECLKFGKRMICDSRLSNQQVLEDHLRQIREKDQAQRATKSSKLKDEREFLNFVSSQLRQDKAKQRRDLESMKREFIEINKHRQIQNQIKQEDQDRQKKAEKFYYFPFTQGEKVEKGRKELSNYLKNEWLQHMQMQKQSQGPKDELLQRRASSQLSKYKSTLGGSFAVGSPANSGYSGTNSNKHTLVGTLFDTQGFNSHKQKSFIQEEPPVKQAVMKEALSRLEQQLHQRESENQINELRISQYRDQQCKEQQVKQEKANTSLKYLKESLHQQIILKQQQAGLQKLQWKEKLQTHFGPEEREEDLQRMRDQQKQNKRFMNVALLRQINESKQVKRDECVEAQQKEKQVNDHVGQLLKKEKEQRAELEQLQNNNLKKFWVGQVSLNEEKRKRGLLS